MISTRRQRLGLLASAAIGFATSPVAAFVPAGTNASDSRWQTTASGGTGVAGDPITLTWSLVPDDVPVGRPENTLNKAPSKLISAFDATFGAGPGGADLTQRPWFTYFQQSFDRLSELAGVTFVYEPNDDGVSHNAAPGVLGVRGDIRIGGIGMDGLNGTLAYNFFPSGGADMALDTDDLAVQFVNPTGGFRVLRNTIMHEAGHGLGLEHSSSGDVDFLMEPNINAGFDGPQHDDLRGFHWMYGDAFEKGGRNETAATATDLGVLALGGSLTIGAGGTGASIGPTETDFVSISNENDDDFFSFTISEPISLDAVMTPRGANYNQGATPFVTTETSDLSLAIFDSDGSTVLVSESSGAAGVAESVTGFTLTDPGTYYARVRGPVAATGQVTQFYQLDLTAGVALPGDFNGDGIVDAVDYTQWRDTSGAIVAAFSGADHSGNGLVDAADYALWQDNFGATLAIPAAAIPEPNSLVLFGLVALSIGRKQERTRFSASDPHG